MTDNLRGAGMLFSMFPFVSAVCKIVAFEGKKWSKAAVCLTPHPPGTPPAHHAARPGWIPGPGSLHCETAGGHSHRAAEAEDKIIMLTSTATLR